MVKITERAQIAAAIREDRPFEVDFLKDESLVSEALKELKSREQGIRKYCEIMNSVVPRDKDFQRKFNAFYRVRRNEEWRRKFFETMSDCQKKEKVHFAMILQQIFDDTGRVEASFSSKMLATINPNMPIWDSRVARLLGIRKPKGKTSEDKIDDAIGEYDFIFNWYRYLFVLKKPLAEDLILRFDTCFPEYKGISGVKKIDFLLWAFPAEKL